MTPTEFAALAVAQLLALSRILAATKAAWGIIPPRYQWIPAFALTAVTELSVKLATGVHTWTDVAVPVLVVLSTLAPGARSNVHAALDGAAQNLADSSATLSRNGYDRLTRGAATPSTAVMALMLCLGVLLTGCAGATPQAQGALAANEARLGYSTAAVVVTELAKLDADWMASLQDPEAAKAALPAAQKISAALDAATASLKVVRSYLTDGGDEAKARAELTNALKTSEDLLELLAEVGKKPPPEVLDAVGYLHGFLLGAGS